MPIIKNGTMLDAGSTKDTPYLALTGELWAVLCEYLWENWPRYNGTAMYQLVDLFFIVIEGSYTKSSTYHI